MSERSERVRRRRELIADKSPIYLNNSTVISAWSGWVPLKSANGNHRSYRSVLSVIQRKRFQWKHFRILMLSSVVQLVLRPRWKPSPKLMINIFPISFVPPVLMLWSVNSLLNTQSFHRLPTLIRPYRRWWDEADGQKSAIQIEEPCSSSAWVSWMVWRGVGAFQESEGRAISGVEPTGFQLE